MATFLAHITIVPGREAEFEAIARELHEASHANEDRLVRYEYWRGAQESTYYCLASFPDHRGRTRVSIDPEISATTCCG